VVCVCVCVCVLACVCVCCVCTINDFLNAFVHCYAVTTISSMNKITGILQNIVSFHKSLLQKRRMILSILLNEATAYLTQ